MRFVPFPGTVEVEPIEAKGIIMQTDNKWLECAKIIQSSDPFLIEGDTVFFRPHGFFETPDIDGKKHYVVKVGPEFILGKLTNVG